MLLKNLCLYLICSRQTLKPKFRTKKHRTFAINSNANVKAIISVIPPDRSWKGLENINSSQTPRAFTTTYRGEPNTSKSVTPIARKMERRQLPKKDTSNSSNHILKYFKKVLDQVSREEKQKPFTYV